MNEPVCLRRPTPREAPTHLSDESAAWWAEVPEAFELEAHHFAILERACEAMDRLRQAQDAIGRDGITVEGRFGPKAHPAISIERDSRTAFLRAVRELGLDMPAPDSRPPSRWQQ